MNEMKVGKTIGVISFISVLMLSLLSVIPITADPGQSTFALSGLTNGRITWSGFPGDTVWSNNSGDGYETMELHLNVVSSDNVTELRIWIGDLNEEENYITASHISLQLSSDGITWGSNTISFSNGGSNKTINRLRWTTSNGCYGLNPFNGVGITGKETTIYCRFKLIIPDTVPSAIYYSYDSTSWKVYIITSNEILPPLTTPSLPPDGSNFSLKWSVNLDMNQSFVPPVTQDINGDGKQEIFLSGVKNANTENEIGEILCIDSSTGSIIWQKNYFHNIYTPAYDRYVGGSCPLIVVDLDKDGDYEVVHSAGLRTIALNANDGTEFWNVSVSSGWHQFSYIEKNGEVILYVSDHKRDNYNPKISKLWGRNGSVIKQADMYYSCYGGISIGDLDGDGNYEIVVTDRGQSYGAQAKGVRVYDEDLNLLWNYDGFTCSSHCAMLYDVNGDGQLEVIVGKQCSSGSTSGGLYIFNADGTIYGSINTGLSMHVQPAIGDLTGDGHVVLTDGFNTPTSRIFNVSSMSVEFTIPYSVSEPPDIANVIADDDLEIVVCRGSPIVIYKYINGVYVLIDSIPVSGFSSVTQDIDNDGYNELIIPYIHSINPSKLRVYETGAETSTPRARTNIHYGGERKTNNFQYYPAPYHNELFELYETLLFGGKASIGTITEDNTPPTISNVQCTSSNPMDTQSNFGWENISSKVTDNIGVAYVRLLITNPLGTIYNVSMIKKTGSNVFYYRNTYSQSGNYSYKIWAKDISGNTIHSSNYKFSLASNWDVNNDGKCTVLDQLAISSHYGAINAPGWIREDADNNGEIQVLDLVYVSNHYGESWWD